MSIFSKLFLTILSSSILAWLRDFVSRVTGDGGTLSDQGHTKDVYTKTYPYGPTLIQTCDSVGSTAQNFAVGSENISNASSVIDSAFYWFISGVTAASSSELNPFGVSSGVTLVAETGSATAHGFYQQPAYQATVVSGQAYTVSAYVKKGDGSLAPDIIQVTHLSTNFGSNFYANYNINTGVVTKVNGGFADIQDIGGGWYRISLAGVATSSGSSGTFVFAFANNDPNAVRFPSYTGNVNRDVYIWGVQFVQGNEPGEYIKTTTTAIDSIGTLYSAVVNPQALLETYTGSAAAYSLRSLSASTTNVVKVRRSSDDTEEDFTAAEITDGTLLTFVNADVAVYTSDFSSLEDLSEFNGTDEAVQSVGGVDDAYKFTLSGGGGSHFAYLSIHEVGQSYEVSFDVYIPSSNSAVDGVLLTLFGVQDIVSTSTTDEWVTLTATYSANYINANFYATDGGNKTVNGDGDVFYLKNIVFTQTTADGHVTTWYDQSGNGNNATQATAANQPKIVSAGSLVTANGKASIDFDGVDDSLALNDGALPSNINNVSAFTVQLFGGGGIALRLGAPDPQNRFYLLFNDNFGYGNNAFAISNLSVTVNNQYLISAIAGSTQGDAQPFVNGVSAGSTSLQSGVPTSGSGSISVPGIQINGAVQEVIIYHSDQSANRTGIEGNINDYYNIYP